MSVRYSALRLRAISSRSLVSPGYKNLVFCPTVRLFHTLSDKKQVVKSVDPGISVPMDLKTPTISLEDGTEYLKDFKLSELFSYFVIGMCTLNKPILNSCIKAFPYVPLPVIKAFVYKIYCGGETVEETMETGERLKARSINNMMLSLTIEACDGNANVDPDYIVEETKKSIKNCLVPHAMQLVKEMDINSFPPGYVALKPTGFAEDAAKVLKYFKSDPKYAVKFDDLVEKASEICGSVFEENLNLSKLYPERVAPFVVAVIDAEKHELQEGVYELQRRLYAKYNLPGKPVSVVGTLQMYLSNSSNLLSLEENLAKANNYKLGLKLVRGAYIHSEKERNAIIHKTKEETDQNYNKGISYCIENILSKGSDSVIGHLVVASHNSDSLRLTTSKLKENPENLNRSNVVMGQLLGMADNITFDLIKNHGAKNVIKYVPWGPPLETKEYLLRRLEENGDAVRSDNGLKLIKAVSKVLFRRLIGLV